jgi:hypothetical protein
MPDTVFKQHYCFQVGDEEEVLYFASSTDDDRKDWIRVLKQAAKANGNKMLPSHHTNVYLNMMNKWMCCQKEKRASGCAPSRGLDHRECIALESIKTHQHSDNLCLERFTKAEASTCTNKHACTCMDEHMICLQSYMPPGCQKILSIKFMTNDVIVLMMDSNSVHIYDIPSNTVTRDIRLTHHISSLDVWNYFLLIGSSVVHIMDTREDRWRSITVIDTDENESLSNPSQHFAVFNSNGEFATASSTRNKLSLWPRPLENGELMTKKKTELPGGSDMKLISGLLTTKNGCLDVLLVLGKMHSGNTLLKIIQWGQEQTVFYALTLSGSEDISSLSVTADGRLE